MCIAGGRTSFPPNWTCRASSTSRLSSSCGSRSEPKKPICANLWSPWSSSWLHGLPQSHRLTSSTHRSGRKLTPLQQPCRSVPALFPEADCKLDPVQPQQNDCLGTGNRCVKLMPLARPELVLCSDSRNSSGTRTELLDVRSSLARALQSHRLLLHRCSRMDLTFNKALAPSSKVYCL